MSVRLPISAAALKEEGITGGHSGSTQLFRDSATYVTPAPKTSVLSNNLRPTVKEVFFFQFGIFFHLIYCACVQLTSAVPHSISVAINSQCKN